MCQVGARNETAQQLKKLLSVDHLSDADFLALNNDYLTTVNSGLGQNVKINTANKIYPHNKFQINKEFTDLLSKHFQSEVELVNYGDAQASANTINTWVANKTGQKIKDLIDASVLNDLTRLVLVNAIYFKGDWKTKFQPDQTTKETFYMSAESSKQVDMMKLFNKKFNYLYSPGGLSCGALELPYVGDSIAMTIILPNEGTYVEEIEKKLTPEILHEILTGFLPTETVNLQLPKFKLEYKQEVILNIALCFIDIEFLSLVISLSLIPPFTLFTWSLVSFNLLISNGSKIYETKIVNTKKSCLII